MTTVALLVLATLLTVFAHPPVGVWPLAFVVLAPLLMAIEGRSPGRAFLLTYAYQVAMGAGIIRWVVNALSGEFGVSLPIAWLVTFTIPALLVLLHGTAVALFCALRPRVGLVFAPLLFGALWALADWVRGGVIGLPWVLLGLTVHRFPPILQVADLGGLWLVAFVMASAAAGLGLAACHRSWTPLVSGATVLALALAYGGFRLVTLERGPGPGVRVAVVQAALVPSQRFQLGTAERNVTRHLTLSLEALAERPADLVVWAETSVDADLDAAPKLRGWLESFATETRTRLVTGAPRSRGGRPTNSVVLFAPERGLLQVYDKQVLVPFSEYDPPLASVFELVLGPMMEGTPYRSGEEATVFRDGIPPFAAPVCWEITYPGLVRRFWEGGARLLVNLSNDAWFGRTGYAEMHFAHAVLRAIEFRTWVVRGANTGISALVDPTGRVVAELPVFEEGTLLGEVHPAGAPPFYGRWGDPPVVAALLLLVLAAAIHPRRRTQ